MEKHLALLGFKVRDIVTNFEGVVESIGFDLYGCVQAVVKPSVVDEKGQPQEGRWFDLKRLVALSDSPIMPVPSFEVVPGGTNKPAHSSSPVR
jgi:hypothetical protein